MIQIRKDLKEESEKLIELGKTVKTLKDSAVSADSFWERRKLNTEASKEENVFKANVLDLEKQHDRFKEELQYEQSNPLVYIGKLVAGVICAILSFIWFLHIILYVLPSSGGKSPSGKFLNSLLLSLEEGGVAPLATCFLMIFSLYLLGCVINGFFEIGVKIPFLFSLHTMKVNETWMNSFLFNILVILMTCAPLLQFLLKSFREYARYSELAS